MCPNLMGEAARDQEACFRRTLFTSIVSLQVSDYLTVGRWELVFSQRVERNPFDSITLQRSWLPLQERAMENMKRYEPVTIGMVNREAIIFHSDLNTEFLAQFSFEAFLE